MGGTRTTRRAGARWRDNLYTERMKFLAKALLVLVLAGTAVPALAATQGEPQEALNGRMSANWAGYVAARGKYTAVGATWVVPTVAASTTLMTDVTWVGIGGSKTRDLIQAGTHGATQNGKIEYWAWYELLPDYQVSMPIAVKGGDTVTVSITEISRSLWLISFSNDTTGASYHTTAEYRSKYSSAEWIEEMPVVYNRDRARAYAPLSEFGSAAFSSAYAVVNGVRKDIDDLRAHAVTMVSKTDKRVILATPSMIESGAFVVSRSKAVPSPKPLLETRNYSNAADIVWSR